MPNEPKVPNLPNGNCSVIQSFRATPLVISSPSTALRVNSARNIADSNTRFLVARTAPRNDMASCHFERSTLSFGAQYLVISSAVPCHLERSTLSFRAQYLVISSAAPCHFERSTLSFGAQHLVIWSATPCHLERSTLSFGAQHPVIWSATPCHFERSEKSHCDHATRRLKWRNTLLNHSKSKRSKRFR